VLRRLASRSAAASLPLLTLVAACSGSSHVRTTVTTPADTLAALAAKGAAATYAATYAFHEASPDTTATVQVWHAEPSLRVDVVAGGTTATLLVTPTGSYSCSMTSTKRSCLLVAAAGAPVPAPFDVAPANLFSADLRALATQTSSYDVASAPALPAAGAVPAAQCFHVTDRASAAAGRVPSGRYCFTTTGLLAAASYPSGNTVRVTSVQTATPSAGEFTPYAKPTPLPS
jgi:hypothetical protein